MAGSVVVRVHAPAKINLLLRVLDRRPDGFHELRTLFQSIALHDTLTVRTVRGPFQLSCTDPACPTDRTNLVWRAAERVWNAAGRAGAPANVALRLTKRVPMQAGLGGGSSDAAAALRVLGARWGVGIARLRRIAESLGSDVPYFFEGGTVLGTGRGERLTALDDLPPFWVTLVIPDFGVSTADAYGWLDRERLLLQGAGPHPRAAPRSRRGARVYPEQGVRAALTALDRESGSVNDLEGPVIGRHPEIGRIVRALTRAGAASAGMSGSGSAVFGLFHQRAAAERAARAHGTPRRRTLVTRTLARAPYQRMGAVSPAS